VTSAPVPPQAQRAAERAIAQTVRTDPEGSRRDRDSATLCYAVRRGVASFLPKTYAPSTPSS